MLAFQIDDVKLQEMWCDDDPEIRSRSAYVTHWQAGTKSSAAVYFEVDPGSRFGRHRHSAEETILVLEGEVELTVADESQVLTSGGPAGPPAPRRAGTRRPPEGPPRAAGVVGG